MNAPISPFARVQVQRTLTVQLPRSLPHKRKPSGRPAHVPDVGDVTLANAFDVLEGMQTGSVEADRSRAYKSYRDELVLKNAGLIRACIHPRLQFRDPDMYADLVQQGNLGLLRAAEDYDPKRGSTFSTYAVYWIRAKIKRFLQTLKRDTNPNIPVELSGAKDAAGNRVRLPAVPWEGLLSVNGDDDSASFGDQYTNPNAPSPEDLVISKDIQDRVREATSGEDVGAWRKKSKRALLHKEERTQQVKVLMEQRLLADEPLGYREVGELTNLSREGVRLMENSVLQDLRKRLKS